MKALILSTCFLLTFISHSNASEPSQKSTENIRQKGQWYGYWGWNRAQYSDSDIHFTGDDHDFTLHNTSAKDRQNTVSGASIINRYLNPMNLTIPQYNYRVGYFVADNWSFSLGFDHMKYVVEQGQVVGMTGTISTPGFEKTNPSREQKVLTEDFMNFEHTDGLNMIALETEYFHSLWNYGNEFDFALLAGAGIGAMIPKTNVKMMNYKRNDEWHLSGYATTLKAGFELTFFHNWFFRGVAKFGYTNLGDVLTTSEGGTAAQSFYFEEYIGAIGYRF